MPALAIQIDADAAACPQCGSSRLYPKMIKTTLWQGERLVVVEGIPALNCESCHENFFDDGTVTQFDLLQAGGFPEGSASGFVNVPVFAFERQVGLGAAEALEEFA